MRIFYVILLLGAVFGLVTHDAEAIKMGLINIVMFIISIVFLIGMFNMFKGISKG